MTMEDDIGSAQFEDLPNELWLSVMAYLPDSDRLQLRLVCRRWCELISQPYFFQRMHVGINKYNLSQVENYLRKDDGHLVFRSIELHSLFASPQLERILTRIGPQVRYLKVKHAPVFQNVDGRLPNLRCLTIESTSAMDTEQHEPVQFLNIRQFKYLVGFECDNASLSWKTKVELLEQMTNPQGRVRMQHLQCELRTDNELVYLQVLEDHASEFRHLNIFFSCAPRFPVEDWARPFEDMTRMQTLKLSGNCTSDVLKAILYSMPTKAPMRCIDLTGIMTLQTDAFKYAVNKWEKTLDTLDVMFCVRLDDKCEPTLKHMRNKFKSLNFSHCRNLSSTCLANSLAFETNYTLHTLYIDELEHIDEKSVCVLAKNLPNLRKLSINNCRKAVTNIAASAIFQYMIKLTELQLEYCVSMTDEAIVGYGKNPYSINRLVGLQVLSLRGCSKLTDYMIRILFLPELRQVMFGYCFKITPTGFSEFVANCPTVEELCVSSCVLVNDISIQSIVMGLKRLRKLNLSNCLYLTKNFINHIGRHAENLEELIIYGISALRPDQVQNYLKVVRPHLKRITM